MERFKPKVEEVVPQPEEHHPTLREGGDMKVTLSNFDNAFPNTEIIERGFDNERPSKERMPSIAQMDRVPPQETIWLTNGAVRERVRVLLHTDLRFNREVPIATAGYSRETDSGGVPVRSLERGARNPIPPQQMIQEFEHMGFAFSSINDRVVMLIDATIPAAKNTNGRVKMINLGAQSTQKGVYYGKAVVPQDEGRVGFQPATLDSTHAVAVPLEDILKMHQEEPDIASHYAMPDQREGMSIRPPIRGEAMDQMKALFYQLRTNSETRDDPALGGRIREIRNMENWQEKKVALYDFLQGAGLNSWVLNGGYFPYEPVYSFLPDRIRKITAQTLKMYGADMKREVQENGAMTTELMLDELLLAL